MSLDLNQLIIINLILMLLLSWGFGFVSLSKMMKDKDALREALKKTREQLKEALAIEQEPEMAEHPEGEEGITAEEAVEVLSDESDLINTILQLTDSMAEKEERLKKIEAIRAEQEDLIRRLSEQDNLSEEDKNLIIDNTKEQDQLIQMLQDDLSRSTQRLRDLQTQLNEARYALMNSERGRTDDRLKDNLRKLRLKNQALTDDLKRLQDSGRKAWNLQAKNIKLKDKIQTLTKESFEQRNTIEQLNFQLKQQINSENKLLNRVKDLEKKLSSEGDDNIIQELEEKLREANDELERTVREKEFIESHMLELDKNIESSLKKEEQIANTYAGMEEMESIGTSHDINNYPTEPIPDNVEDVREPTPEQQQQDARENKDKSLYNALTSFWSQYVPTPVSFVDNKNPNPQHKFDNWVQIRIGENSCLMLGIDSPLNMSLAHGLFDTPEDKLNATQLQDSLARMVKTITENMASNYFPDENLSSPEFMRHEDAEVTLQHSSPTAEILTTSRKLPIYIALIEE